MQPAIGFFERYLSIWVVLCMATGMVMGNVFPALFQTIAALQYANVNLLVAVLIWIMIYPMMVAVDFSSMQSLKQRPQGLLIGLVINWLIKPFSMALLAVVFLQYLFAPFLDAQRAQSYIAGLIILGAAPCTAMVFIWSRLVNGDPNYTVAQVTLNDLIMIVAFAPIVALLLGVSNIHVPWNTLLFSVLLYVVLPIMTGYITQHILSTEAKRKFQDQLKPYAVIGLLLTIILLFAFQAKVLLEKPFDIMLIAVPIVLQSLLVFALTYFWMKKVCLPHCVAAPAALIGGSNFFELAVAVAISLFGLQSGAVLATVVGVLVEVPAMLWLVGAANRTRHWFKH